MPFFAFLPGPNKPGLGFSVEFVKRYLSRSLAANRSVIVIPAAVGDTSLLEHWLPPDRIMYSRALAAIDVALAMDPSLAFSTASRSASPTGAPSPSVATSALRPHPSNRVAAIVWHQGETTNRASERQHWDRLSRTVAGIRAHISRRCDDAAAQGGLASGASLPCGESVPFIAGQLESSTNGGIPNKWPVSRALARLWADPTAAAAGAGGVSDGSASIDGGVRPPVFTREAADALASGDAPGGFTPIHNASLVTSLGLRYRWYDLSSVSGEVFHFDVASAAELGARYHAAYLWLTRARESPLPALPTAPRPCHWRYGMPVSRSVELAVGEPPALGPDDKPSDTAAAALGRLVLVLSSHPSESWFGPHVPVFYRAKLVYAPASIGAVSRIPLSGRSGGGSRSYSASECGCSVAPTACTNAWAADPQPPPLSGELSDMWDNASIPSAIFSPYISNRSVVLPRYSDEEKGQYPPYMILPASEGIVLPGGGEPITGRLIPSPTSPDLRTIALPVYRIRGFVTGARDGNWVILVKPVYLVPAGAPPSCTPASSCDDASEAGGRLREVEPSFATAVVLPGVFASASPSRSPRVKSPSRTRSASRTRKRKNRLR